MNLSNLKVGQTFLVKTPSYKSTLETANTNKPPVFKLDGKVYTLNEIKDKWPNGVEVKGDLDLADLGLGSLPFKIKSIGGDFYCMRNKLTSLNGGPDFVGGDFYLFNNNLTSLSGSPKIVKGSFLCSDNKLTSLKGGPKEVGGDFGCFKNNLTSLEGAPQKVGGNFYCHTNKKNFTVLEVKSACKVKGRIIVKSNSGMKHESL